MHSHTVQNEAYAHECAGSVSEIVGLAVDNNTPRNMPRQPSFSNASVLQREQSWCSHITCSDDADSDCNIDDAAKKLQTEMRNQIIAIQTDSKLNATQKSKLVQELMTRKWAEKVQETSRNDPKCSNKLSDKKPDFEAVTYLDKSQTFHVFYR